MTTLSVNRASGGDDIAINCISFRCDAWPVDVHLCSGYDDIAALLEDSTEVTFVAADYSFVIPDIDSNENVSASFAINGAVPIQEITGTLTPLQLIAQAEAAREPIYIELRAYLLSDLSAPAEVTKDLRLSGRKYTSPIFQGDASFYNFKDTRFPRAEHDYNVDDYPGIEYIA